MIKWSGTGDDGRTVVGLGITRANVDALKLGMPIEAKGEEFGLDGVTVVIHYGETEAKIVDALRAHGVTTPLQRRDV